MAVFRSGNNNNEANPLRFFYVALGELLLIAHFTEAVGNNSCGIGSSKYSYAQFSFASKLTIRLNLHHGA
jgi:hypothetical protein